MKEKQVFMKYCHRISVHGWRDFIFLKFKFINKKVKKNENKNSKKIGSSKLFIEKECDTVFIECDTVFIECVQDRSSHSSHSTHS